VTGERRANEGLDPRWRVTEHEGNAADLHARSAELIDAGTAGAPGTAGRVVRVLTSTDRAVVLGSGQDDSDVDRPRAEALGISVVRRRSGGGAVLVGPGDVIWLDIVVPAGDALWVPDVGRACWWLGDTWIEALASVGLRGGRAWRGPMVRSAWSDRVCFAGLGAGEVTLDDRKVVGISQRRTRAGALFQCAVPIQWDPRPLVEVLRWRPGEGDRAEADLAGVATGIGADRAEALVSAFVARLD
jgi:lipoate---protein ligase